MSSTSSDDSSLWQLGDIELGGESDSSAESARAEADNIGPVSVSTGSYPYTLQQSAKAGSPPTHESALYDAANIATPQLLPYQQLNVHADQSKGLSFQIWPSALNLSRFAEAQHAQHHDCWKGKRVVELGSGCGLVGLVFACLGAHVLLTDLSYVLGIAEANVRSNTDAISVGGGTAEVAQLSWGATDVSQMGTWAAPDLVIAADVIYDRALFEPLLHTLNGYRPGTEILLAHVRRWKSDAHFFKALRKAGYTLVDVTAAGGECKNGLQPDATTTTDKIGKGAAALQQTSMHTKGALKIFRLLRPA